MAKPKQNNKAPANKVREEDIVIYKIMVAMLIVAAIVCGLVMLYYRYQKMTYFLLIYRSTYVGSFVGLIAAVICGICAAVKCKQPKLCCRFSIAAACALALAGCCSVMHVYSWEGVSWLFIVFPAALVLYILRLIYQPELFWMALLGAISGIGFYIYYQMAGIFAMRLGMALLLLLAIACMALLAFRCGKDGLFRLGKGSLRLCNAYASRRLLLVTAALCLAGWLLSVLLGGMLCLVSAGVILLWLVVMACVFTVKLG